MSLFPITLLQGSIGSVTLANDNGSIALKIEGNASLGGGAASGIVSPQISMSFPVSLPQATHLLALFLEKEFPVGAAAIASGDALAEAAEKSL